MTDTQSPPESPQAVLCPQCGHTLGTCTPTELHVGPVRFRASVRLECSQCGKQRTWQPSATR